MKRYIIKANKISSHTVMPCSRLTKSTILVNSILLIMLEWFAIETHDRQSEGVLGFCLFIPQHDPNFRLPMIPDHTWIVLAAVNRHATEEKLHHRTSSLLYRSVTSPLRRVIASTEPEKRLQDSAARWTHSPRG